MARTKVKIQGTIAVPEQAAVRPRPIYVRIRPDDDDPDRGSSSRGADRLTRAQRVGSKAAHRIAKAVHRGLDTFIERQDKSARKRRDGALVDLAENAAVDISRTLSEASPVIIDLARAMNTKGHRRRVRRMAASVGKFQPIAIGRDDRDDDDDDNCD